MGSNNSVKVNNLRINIRVICGRKKKNLKFTIDKKIKKIKLILKSEIQCFQRTL